MRNHSVHQCIGLPKGVQFRSEIAIVGTEIRDTQFGHKFESSVRLRNRPVIRIGIAIPRALEKRFTKHIPSFAAKGVPIGNREPELLARFLSAN